MAQVKDNIVVDTETFGLKRGSMMLSLAAIAFDPDDPEAMQRLLHHPVVRHDDWQGMILMNDLDPKESDLIVVRIPLIDSIALGMKADEGTVAWWRGKGSSLLDYNLLAGPLDGIRSGIEYFDNWLANKRQQVGKLKAWANSPVFDFERIMRPYYEALGREFPIQFREERCVRTIRDEHKIPYRDMKEMGLRSHNPLHDCLIQAYDVNYARARMRVLETLDPALFEPFMAKIEPLPQALVTDNSGEVVK